MKPLDICRVFEAERCNLAEAAAAAEADAAAARKALQQAQVCCTQACCAKLEITWE